MVWASRRGRAGAKPAPRALLGALAHAHTPVAWSTRSAVGMLAEQCTAGRCIDASVGAPGAARRLAGPAGARTVRDGLHGAVLGGRAANTAFEGLDIVGSFGA